MAIVDQMAMESAQLARAVVADLEGLEVDLVGLVAKEEVEGEALERNPYRIEEKKNTSPFIEEK